MPSRNVIAFHVAKERGELIERLKARAAKERRSVSWLICEAVENYLTHEEIAGAMRNDPDTANH
uniref:Putative ribbon-helix-helix protein repressor n=1 Tax=viral metagenome TaxID=1070528 RepID=A0A6H1Z6P4_9ZZZZ